MRLFSWYEQKPLQAEFGSQYRWDISLIFNGGVKKRAPVIITIEARIKEEILSD